MLYGSSCWYSLSTELPSLAEHSLLSLFSLKRYSSVLYQLKLRIIGCAELAEAHLSGLMRLLVTAHSILA